MPLPCTHFKPASMTDHLELSTMIGTREISGSAASRFRNFVITASPSSRAFVEIHVEHIGAAFDLAARHAEPFVEFSVLDQAGEFFASR